MMGAEAAVERVRRYAGCPGGGRRLASLRLTSYREHQHRCVPLRSSEPHAYAFDDSGTLSRRKAFDALGSQRGEHQRRGSFLGGQQGGALFQAGLE